MNHNHKRFIQYGLALTAGLGLGAFSITSPAEAVLAFNRLTLNAINNGITLNGITFNGSGTKGITLSGSGRIQPNATTATLAGKPVQEFSVEGGQLVFRLPSSAR